ncbi:hypothetical protein ASE01_23310 [Nocardioides sp. Root190]|nr:hypothetical protein ASE01_23310 [Nocardioides sp. Root190]
MRISTWSSLSPSVWHRDRQPEHTELLETLDDLSRVLIGVLELLSSRNDLLVGELTNSLEDLDLVLVESLGLAQARHRFLPFGKWYRAGGTRRHSTRE